MSGRIRSGLLTAGVANLREFGYPHCTDESILTDPVYSAFFKSMLDDNKGHSADIDKEIDALLAAIAKATQP